MRFFRFLITAAAVRSVSANVHGVSEEVYELFNPPKPYAKKIPAKASVTTTAKTSARTASKAPAISIDSNNDLALKIGLGALSASAIGAGILSAADSKSSSGLVPTPKEAVKVVETAVVQRKAPSKKLPPKGASIPNEVFNLVKAIVGVGVLSLPAGVAAFGDSPSAFIPAGILITVIGMLSAYGFALIGKVCAYTGAKSYRDAWSRTVGEETSWIPAWSTTLKTFLACLAFSMVLADTFSSLFETDRTTTLLGVTAVVLLPLCLKKNLKSLAPFSLLGVLGMIYTAVAMTVRWLDSNYAYIVDTVVAPDGAIHTDIREGKLLAHISEALRPAFGEKGITSVFHPSSLILVCMLSTAYMAHFNAPKFYHELENNTLPRFHSVVSWSFGISIFLMGFITMIGFLTFGKSCDGLVLNNYASSDPWMSGSRIAVAVSLVFSYPLAFTGFRDGFLDLSNVPMDKRGPAKLNSLTMILLGIITFLAASLRDVSFVLAMGGATLGNALTYVYPALMYRAVVKQQKRTEESRGVTLAMASAVLGIAMGLVGAHMALTT